MINNHFTLYIDESGDFISNKGSWLVGGLLISNGFRDVEHKMSLAFKELIKPFGFNSIEDFHLTDIREQYNYDHQKVSEFIRNFFDTLNEINLPYCFITTNNKTKISTNDPERTYRLMLLDLILQAESAVFEVFNQEIQKLDLVVATRTINGVRQTTSGEIYQEVLQSLPKGLESDLVAMGQLALLGNNLTLYTENARKQWGLISADFICNLTYNQRHYESQAILDLLKKSGKLYAYDTFSSPELRKVLSHEHNQNYASAVFDCLKILEKSQKSKDYKDIFMRLLKKALIESGTTGSIINFDSILEKIWRDKIVFSKHTDKVKILVKLQSYIEELDNKQSVINIISFQYKLRNLILLGYNHLGEVEHALNLITIQKVDTAKLISNPEYFTLVLDFYAREVEVYVNSLDFDSAEKMANKYFELIVEYQSIWELISPDLSNDEFFASSISIRARSLLLRSLLLNFNTSKINLITQLISELKPYALHPLDISRIHCQELIFLMKQNKLEHALEQAYQAISGNEKPIIFDKFFFLFVFNQNLLLTYDKNTALDKYKNLVEIIHNDNKEIINYPAHLIYRELSLYYRLNMEKKRPIELLKKSKELSLKTKSPIVQLLDLVNDMQLEFINDGLKSKNDYINEYKSNSKIQEIMDSNENDNALFVIRYYLSS